MFRKIPQDLRNYIFKQIEKEIKLNNNAAKDQLEKGEKLEIEWSKNQKQWICLGGKLMMGPMFLAILYFAPCKNKTWLSLSFQKILFEKDSFLQTFDFLELHSSNSLDLFLLVH